MSCNKVSPCITPPGSMGNFFYIKVCLSTHVLSFVHLICRPTQNPKCHAAPAHVRARNLTKAMGLETSEVDQKNINDFLRNQTVKLRNRTKTVVLRQKMDVAARLGELCNSKCCDEKKCLKSLCQTHPCLIAHHISRWADMSRRQKTTEAFHYLMNMRSKKLKEIDMLLATGVRVSKDGVTRVIHERERESIKKKKTSYYLYDPESRTDVQVCLSALQQITQSFGGNLRTSIDKMLDEGHEQHYGELSFARRTRSCTKSATVLAWVDHIKLQMGDHMPDKEDKMWLPYDNWKEAHAHYTMCIKQRLFVEWAVEVPASLSLFRKLVSVHYKRNIKFAKKYNTFTKCNSCSDYKIQIKRCGAGSVAGGVWLKHYFRHLMWQAKCRMKYHTHRSKAKAFPHKYMSLIIDGSDNHSFEIPFFGDKRKDWANLDRPKTRSTGVLVHTDMNNPMFGGLHLYITDERTKKGTNFNITVMLHTILAECEARGGKLPPFVYLQMDSAGDNKSKTMARFAEWLVKSGVFLKVKICMLPVGHTHEDIDASFGRLNRRFVENGTVTLTTGDAVARARNATKCTRNITWIKVSVLCLFVSKKVSCCITPPSCSGNFFHKPTHLCVCFMCRTFWISTNSCCLMQMTRLWLA